MDRTEEARPGKIDPIILAVDCCNLAPSAALVRRGTVAAGAAAGREAGSIESILEICRSVFQASAVDFSDLSLLGVSVGPGSFTGIRTAIGTAEGLAAGLHLPIYGIALPLAIAVFAAQDGSRGTIAVSSPANPNEDFAAWYRIDSADSAAKTLTITPLTPIVSIQKGFLQSSPAALLAAEFRYGEPPAPSESAVTLIESESFFTGRGLTPAAVIGVAVSAISSGQSAVAVISMKGEDSQLQYLPPGPDSSAAISALYGKPVNAKTLIERGKAIAL